LFAQPTIQRVRSNLHEIILLFLVGIHATFWSALFILKYNIFSLHTDTGNGNLLESSLAVSVFPFNAVRQGLSELPDVISPHIFSTAHTNIIILFFAPFYAIAPYTETLLISSSIVLASGAIPLYLIAKNELHNKTISLSIAISYLLCPALLAANMPDFNYLVFAVPFLLSAFYFYKKENWKFYWLFIGLSLTIREELGLAVMFLGIFIFFFQKNRKVGLATIIIGLVTFLILLYVLSSLPYDLLEGTFRHLAQEGKGFLGIIETIFINPSAVYEHFLNSNAGFYLLEIFFHTAFLSLLSPGGFLISFPELAKNLLATNDIPFRLIWNHYQLLLVPGLFLSTIYSIKKISRKFKTKKTLVMTSLSIILIFSAILSNSLSSGAPLIGLEFSISDNTISLEKRNVWWWEFLNFSHFGIPSTSNPSFLIYQEQFNSVNKAIDLIPKDASVSSQDNFVSHLSGRSEVYLFPIYYDKVDYVLVMEKVVAPFDLGYVPQEMQTKYISLLKNDRNHEIIFNENGLLLLKKIK